MLFICDFTYGQDSTAQNLFFEPAPTFNKKRFNTTLAMGIGAYAGTSVGLYNTWYKDYAQGNFHFFNDQGEWKNMDKAGHIYSGYFQSVLAYKAAKWTGLTPQKSMLTGVITAGIFQSTLEVMDGFTSKWGFSAADFTSNILGMGTFYFQEKYLGEQRIILKHSSFPSKHDFQDDNCSFCPSIAAQRADDLFGNKWLEKALKDYNFQSYWLSFDVHTLSGGHNRWPKWLNLAIGYGAKNLYGGFSNQWIEGNQIIDLSRRPRTSQYFLSLDINFDKIETRSGFLRTLLTFLNTRKIPSPTLEYNKLDGFVFHVLFL